MTREQFRGLAERASRTAQQHPGRYRVKVALWAAAGYAVLFGMMTVTLGVIVAVGLVFGNQWFWDLAANDFRVVVVAAAVIFVMASLLFSISRSFFLRWPLPAGRRVTRSEAPKLFALIDEVVKRTGASMPHVVMFTSEFNAAVVQRPRWGWFGKSQDYLLIGLPLIATLRVEEFKGLIAHELAHLRGGHCRFANWIGKLRITWQHLLEQFANGRRRIGSGFRRFAIWYGPRFTAHSCALVRANEFEADKCSVEIAGRNTAAGMLIKIGLATHTLRERFWRRLDDEARNVPEPPPGILRQLISIPREPLPPADRRRAVRTLLAEEEEGTDTHPPLLQRLQQLNFLSGIADASEAIEQLASVPVAYKTALDEYLESALTDQILRELEDNWRVLARSSWQRRFEQAQAMRTRLIELQQLIAEKGDKVATENLLWEQTLLKVELAETEEARISLLTEFVQRHPDHATARFSLGERLLARDHADGVAMVERAIQLDSHFSSAGQLLISAYLRRNGQWEEAAARKTESIRQADMDDAGRAERLRLTRKDSYLPHDLEEATLDVLRKQLSQHPRVSQAWLVRKSVTHHPEHPWYIVVCAVRWRWGELATGRRLQQIVHALALDLKVNGTTDFMVLSHTKRGPIGRIVRKIRKIEGSNVYTAAKNRRWGKDLKKNSVAAPRRSRPVPLPIETVHEPLPALAIAVFLLLLAGPLGFVGFQLRKAPTMWAVAKQHSHSGAAIQVAKETDAQRPIDIAPGTVLSAVDKNLALQWGTRVMLSEGFDQHAPRNPAWYNEAREFIKAALPWWAEIGQDVDKKMLLSRGDHLLSAGCDEPVTLFLIAKLKFATDLQSAEAGILFEKAMHSLERGRYKAALVRLAAEGFVGDCERRNEGTGQRHAPIKVWLKHFSLQFTDGSFTEEEQPVLTRQFCFDMAANLIDDYCNECLAALHSSAANSLQDWVRLGLIGQAEMGQAWHARGNGYANTVTRDGWREFFKHLAEARHDLVDSWKANPGRPEAAARMIKVVMAENDSHGESERLWFDRSVAAQFDFEKAYFNMAWALRPRWNGSLKALMAFGQQCALTNRFDTNVPLHFLYAVRAVAQEVDDKKRVYTQPAIAAELDRVLAEYESQKPPPVNRAYIYGLHAYTAYGAGDLVRAYELLKEIDFELDPELVSEMDPAISPAAFLDQVAALGGPGRDKASSGDRVLAKGDTEAALAAYQAALGECQNEPHAAHYLTSRISTIQFQKNLIERKWIPFHPVSNEMAGWSSVLGTWRLDSDGSLIGQTGGNGMLLVNDSGVGPNFEMRGTIEFLPGSTGEVQAGIAFGFPSWEDYDWRSVRLRRNPDGRSEVTLAQHWKGGPIHTVPTAAKNTFVVQSWRGKLTVLVNGQLVFQDEMLNDGFVKDARSRVGIGAYAHEGNRFSVRYRDLEIRRINTPPSRPESPVAFATEGR